MIMIVTKICQNCQSYDKEEKICENSKEFVCNVNTCTYWQCSLNIIMNNRDVKFVEYEQYKR